MLNEKKISPLKEIHTEFCLNLRVFLKSQKDSEFRKKIMGMASVEESQTAEKKQYFQEMSVVLMENIGLEKNEENMSALLSIANRISINTFTIQDALYNYGGIAIGIYYPCNFINHDCQPNCSQIFDGKKLKILANREI